MCELELTVRELLAAAQQECKAKLDVGRVDTVFLVGDRVILLTCSTQRTFASCCRAESESDC